MTDIQTVTVTDTQRWHIASLQENLRLELFYKAGVTPETIYRRIRRMMLALREAGDPFTCLVEPLFDYYEVDKRRTGRITSVTLITSPPANANALLNFAGGCAVAGEIEKSDMALAPLHRHLRCGGVEPAWNDYPDGTAAYVAKYGVWNPYR